MKNAIIYLRSATIDEDTSKKLSKQQIECQNHAKENNYKIIGAWIDVGASGNNLSRPGLNGMLKSIENESKISAIIVNDLSRIARDTVSVRIFIQRLKYNNVNLEIVDALWKPENRKPEDSFVQDLLIIFSEMESKIKSDRIKRGIAAKKNNNFSSHKKRSKVKNKNKSI